MKPVRARVAAVVLVVGAVVALVARAAASPAEAPRGATATPALSERADVGPRERAPVEGATLAGSFDELRRLVEDPAGPAAIELAAQTYHGDLAIRRPLALRGVKGTVLEGSGQATVLTVEANDVTLENLVVRSSGRRHTAEDAGIKLTGERVAVRDVRTEETLFGISLLACKSCTVERAHVVGWGDDAELRGDGVKLWESNDSVVRGCRVERARDVVVWYTKRATLEDNVVTGGRYGTHFMYAHDSVVRRSRFERNVVGVFVMYSMRLAVEENVLAGARGAAGVGLGFKDSDGVRAKNNWIVANTTGVYLDNTPRVPDQLVVFEDNLIALNDVAASFHTSEKGLVFQHNDFHQNATLIEVDGGGDALAAEVRGNHYSDYEGYDLDGDGRGDVAYEVKALSSELTESRPALKLFAGTAAMGLFDAVARAVPVLSAKKLLSDPAPLAGRPDLPQPRTP